GRAGSPWPPRRRAPAGPAIPARPPPGRPSAGRARRQPWLGSRGRPARPPRRRGRSPGWSARATRGRSASIRARLRAGGPAPRRPLPPARPAPASSRVALAQPVLGESGVLHALAAGDEVAVDDVNGAVAPLDHRRVVVAATIVFLQVAGDCPGLALV